MAGARLVHSLLDTTFANPQSTVYYGDSMMKPESLVQLVGSGNTATVEEEWMRLVEEPDAPPARLAEYDVVLKELCRVDRASQAEELAWAAIETISARHTPQETLTVAAPFLRAVSESDELRRQVLDLYRTIYADREGIEALLAESGVGGRRPVRRALRALEVCLALKVGGFLAGRDDDGTARVEKIDRSDWRFTIIGADGTETLGAVILADRYRPASPTEFGVLQRFAPDQLAERLWKEPAAMVIDICKQHNNRISSGVLEAILVPELIAEKDWKKWWTRARTALKKCPNIKIEGRSPYDLTYVETPIALEDELLEELESRNDPLYQLELIEKYLRACKARGEPPSPPALRRYYDLFAERVRRLAKEDEVQAGLFWVIARRVGEIAGIEGAGDGAVNLLRTSTDLQAVFGGINSDALLDLACTCLVEARPEDWQDQLSALLPTFPLAVCDRASCRLVDAGWGPSEFKQCVERITAAPVEHFEGLLWLWSGPTKAERIAAPPLVTLLSRILRALDECRRSERIPKQAAAKIATRSRAVLAARKYERFERCLDDLEEGMAGALRTQIRRLDSLGRAVRADLLSRLNNKFPPRDSAPALQPWEREDVIYVTAAGFARKQEEIDHHVNVKMKLNAEAIGRAAEHGDLSENSEFKFALEERDLLRARLAQMNTEMAMAQVVTPENVATDHVGVGTKVIFKRKADGELYQLVFVGSWDADAAKGWLNYKTPLAQKVMGMRTGDVIEFDHSGAVGTYEIVGLENALAL